MIEGLREGLPIFEPRNISEQLKNKFLALGFKNVLQKIDKISDSEDGSISILRPKRYNPQNSILGVTLSGIYKKTIYNADADIPLGFFLPAYVIHFYEGNSSLSPLLYQPKITDTPYGELPEYVIGQNKKVFCFSNNYIMNEDGQAVKRQYVSESNRRFSEEEKDVLTNLHFNPSRNHSSYAHLNNIDYGKLEKIVTLIEKGKFTEAR
jgi:hypothetical protein